MVFLRCHHRLSSPTSSDGRENFSRKEIRRDLGEYYTPDWLAELALNEVGWTLEAFEKKAQEQNNPLAPLDHRLLDPTCGSGTFLVLAISRLRQYIEEHWIDRGTALRKITKNIGRIRLKPSRCNSFKG